MYAGMLIAHSLRLLVNFMHVIPIISVIIIIAPAKNRACIIPNMEVSVTN